MSAALHGGCACGAIRYVLHDPYDTGWCHCRLCQKTSGAPAIAFTTARRDGFAWTSGEDHLRAFASSTFGRRQFCDQCGSLLTIQVDFQPDEIDVACASLDDPAAAAPTFHIFCKDALGWAPIDDGLPRYDRFRPDTRGLQPGQTDPEA
ncbi:MAG: GFA family protein [Sphingomonas sp.]